MNNPEILNEEIEEVIIPEIIDTDMSMYLMFGFEKDEASKRPTDISFDFPKHAASL